MISLPQQGDALLVIDVQRDFLAGGALSVPGGEEVVGPLNHYVEVFASRGLPVFASRDWHPTDHCSFAAQGGPWPPHCIASTTGAEFSPALRLPVGAQIISKAASSDRDAYSDFDETDLDDRLRRMHIERLWIAGLATEYCVLYTVRDARARGFDVVLLIDAIRPLNVRPGDGQRAIDEMLRLGAARATWRDIAEQLDGPHATGNLR
jgi:nicotinamidase/pyrazinamidase